MSRPRPRAGPSAIHLRSRAAAGPPLQGHLSDSPGPGLRDPLRRGDAPGGRGGELGGETPGLFGLRTPHAFGHPGFTNILTWADLDRRLAVALLSSGKPFLSLDLARLFDLLHRIGRTFPPI